MPMLKKGGTIGIFSPSYPITADSPGAAIRAEEFFNSKEYKIKKEVFGEKAPFIAAVQQKTEQPSSMNFFITLKLIALWQALVDLYQMQCFHISTMTILQQTLSL